MYKIHLPNFEGPFDLLLYFIKRDEIDIYDIPIARITEEFLDYLKIIKLIDLELAGDFILMASNLMFIKARLLIPQNLENQDDESEDPRMQLVQKLLEYKQIKEAAEELKNNESENLYLIERTFFPEEEEIETVYSNTDIFDMITALKFAIDRLENVKQEHLVEMFPVSTAEQKNEIRNHLSRKGRLSFFEFIKNQNKQFIIVSFLAILEMVKDNEIAFNQDEDADIYLSLVINLN